jgi:uncharacterized C2H2 Zn-finger protein
VRVLKDLLDERLAASCVDGERLFDAERNGEVVRDVKAYYRSMDEGAASS